MKWSHLDRFGSQVKLLALKKWLFDIPTALRYSPDGQFFLKLSGHTTPPLSTRPGIIRTVCSCLDEPDSSLSQHMKFQSNRVFHHETQNFIAPNHPVLPNPTVPCSIDVPNSYKAVTSGSIQRDTGVKKDEFVSFSIHQRLCPKTVFNSLYHSPQFESLQFSHFS